MEPCALVQSLENRGVTLAVDGGRPRFKDLQGFMTTVVREYLRAHRDELIALPENNEATSPPADGFRCTDTRTLACMIQRLSALPWPEGLSPPATPLELQWTASACVQAERAASPMLADIRRRFDNLVDAYEKHALTLAEHNRRSSGE